MAISVHLDSLVADGAALADRQTPQSPVGCEAPGADSVSVWVAQQLSTLSEALTALINHGQQVRTEGGTATQMAAAIMRAADEAGAAVIAGGASTSGVVSTPGPVVVPDPVLPAITPIPPPATTTGEAQAKALYGGHGAASLRAFADHWQSQAATLDNTAADTGQTSVSIDAHWVSESGQQAGANTAAHSNFWSVLAEYARGLGSAANKAADNYDRAATPTATPTPNEFTAAHAQLTKAIAANNASHGLLSGQVHAATAHLAQLQAQAIAAAHAYHTESAATIGSIPGTPAPAKPIAKGSSPSAAPAQSGNGGATNPAQPASNSAQPGASSSSQPAANSGAAATGANATNAATNTSAGSSSTSQIAQSLLPTLEMGMMGPMAALSSLGGQSQQNTPGAMAAQAAGWPGADATSSGLGGDFSDTMPAAGGGGGVNADAAGGAAQALPMASPSPHGPPPAAVSGPGGTFVAPAEGAGTAPAGATGGGMSTYPPMMGAPGAGDHGVQRNIRLFPDRRMVWRPVPNTEAVFGELERERRPRSKRATPEEDSNEG